MLRNAPRPAGNCFCSPGALLTPCSRLGPAPPLPLCSRAAFGVRVWGGFNFNFIAEQLIHGSLSPALTPVMTFHQNEKWSDTAHYSCCLLSQSWGRAAPSPLPFNRLGQ